MRVNYLCLMAAFILVACAETLNAPSGVGPEPVEDTLGETRPVARPVDVPTDGKVGTAKTGLLGTTVATLDATTPGVWLKTPLVNVEQRGTLVFGANRLAVTLIPIEGPATAGSLISLDAMRGLGAPLAGFPELQVFGS